MNCPTCNVSLLITERQGIEIDYCQKCRGVWLDRGELDKLIERASFAPTTGAASASPAARHMDHDDDDHRFRHSKETGYGKGSKRESPIADLFDFF
jgi:Zn-finger nucleic acid-binding protein